MAGGQTEKRREIRCELRLGEDCDCLAGAHATTIHHTARTRRAHTFFLGGGGVVVEGRWESGANKNKWEREREKEGREKGGSWKETVD